MKIKSLLIIALLSSFSLNAETYLMEVPKNAYKNRIQVGDPDSRPLTCESPAFLSLDGSECISYNWTHSWGGGGTRANLNDAASIMKAVDGDTETITELFRAVYTNSRIWSAFTPDRPIENKRITVHWQDYITGGYGNRAHYQLFYVDENGTNIKILNNSNYYSNAAWTDRVQTFDVPYASSIYLWTKDIGKGSPRFKWKEIVIENIPES